MQTMSQGKIIILRRVLKRNVLGPVRLGDDGIIDAGARQLALPEGCSSISLKKLAAIGKERRSNSN